MVKIALFNNQNALKIGKDEGYIILTFIYNYEKYTIKRIYKKRFATITETNFNVDLLDENIIMKTSFISFLDMKKGINDRENINTFLTKIITVESDESEEIDKINAITSINYDTRPSDFCPCCKEKYQVELKRNEPIKTKKIIKTSIECTINFENYDMEINKNTGMIK